MSINYLDKELMEKMCHRLAVAVFDTKDDPIAFFHEHAEDRLDSALNLPRQTFGGKDLYPTLVDKAVILFYALNKGHAFRNGNKRISAASLMVFLYINDTWLDAGKNEIVEKTLYIVDSRAPMKPDEVISNIKQWISEHIVPIKVAFRNE